LTSSWIEPLLVAGAVGLVATPVARKVALANDFVDRPGRRKSHSRVTPYLGGVAIAVAVLIGEWIGNESPFGVFVSCCGLVLLVTGLVDDLRGVNPFIRLLIECATALVVVAAGLRFPGTGSTYLGVAVAFVILVLVTNSSNLLDNLDGLCAGITAAASAGLLAMAAAVNNATTTVMSAALLGACLAFLVFNAKPASIFMGDAGSLYIGFVLTATSLRVASLLSGANRELFPLLVLGVPLADTATVVVARLKNRRPVMVGGRDHISHRLAKAGLGSSRAVAVLIGVEAVMVTLAVLAGRSAIPWKAAAAGGGVILVGLVTIAGRVRVYRRSPAQSREHARSAPADEVAVGRDRDSVVENSRDDRTRSAERPFPRTRPRPAWESALGWAAVVVLLGLVGLASYSLLRAARVGARGQDSLLNALSEAHAGSGALQLSRSNLSVIGQDLTAARGDFSTMQDDLGGGGPLLYLARFVPFVGEQVRATDALANAGVDLSSGTLKLMDAVQNVAFPPNTSVQLDQALPNATYLSSVMNSGVRSLVAAVNDVASLNGYRLVGTLGRARGRLAAKLPPIEARVIAAYRGLNASVGFLGGDGPSSWLFLSQNPEEVRPTGGFIGTYGVIQASGGHVELGQIRPIDEWFKSHPSAAIPEEQAPTVFQVADSVQNLSDVNSSPDFPSDARLALRLWKEGGGVPVEGVISVTPEFLVRLLGVLGSVPLPSYNETLTSSTLLPDLESYFPFNNGSTEEADAFGAAASQAVMQALLHAPASEWSGLVQAMINGFDSGEAMAYSANPSVERPLTDYGWDDALPGYTGDFYADSEFEFVEENGSSLHRVFDHDVVLHSDGSGTASTEMTVEDTAPPAPNNTGSTGYVVAYGPEGARAVRGSDPSYWPGEPSVNGHPAADWLTGAAPLGQVATKVVWSYPGALEPLGGGKWAYSLTWRPLPAHSGDVLQLHVHLPHGWHWVGSGPPKDLVLNGNFLGTWYAAK
jgi:UDP-GlcNAc:undecaprenyl-phosphate GlcNAc-1-phosphate transferase